MALVTVAITGHVLAPDGSAPTSGRLVVKLSQAGSALDGAESVRVATEVTEDLGTGGTVSFALVPNDAITPSGTYYLATFVAQLASGRRVQWAEKWQVDSDTNPVDIGSISRLGVVPGVGVGTLSDTIPVTPVGSTTSRTLAQWLAYLAPWLVQVQYLFDTIGAYLTGSVLGKNSETLSITRASAASYVNSSGALASAVANSARVDARGLVSEESVTSLITTVNMASWTPLGSGVAAPTVTGNTADVLAPDGTQTATKLVFPAVSVASNYSITSSPYTSAATRYEYSVWMRGGAPISETYLYLVDGGATVAHSKRVTLSDRQWTKVSLVTPALAATVHSFAVGTWLTGITGHTSTVASTFYVWGPEAKPLAYETSWTGNTARSHDVASVAATGLGTSQGAGSVWVRPQWSASGAGTDRTILSAAGFVLQFIASTSVWRLTVGGQAVDSAVQTFSAYKDLQLRWRYSTTDKVRLQVDAETEVVSTLAPSTIAPGLNLFVGNSGSAGAGVYLRRLILEPSGSAMLDRAAPTAPQTVATIGDSIVYGYGVTTPWSSTLASLLGAPWKVDNYGVNGDTSAQMLTRWTNLVRAKGTGYLVVAGGINDIRVGTTAASTWSNLKTIIDQAKADGMTVVISTITPFKNYLGQWTAGKQTELDTLNSTIRAYCTSEGHRLVDAYAAVVDPAVSGGWLAAYDQGDNLHPNQAGEDLIASLVKVQIP